MTAKPATLCSPARQVARWQPAAVPDGYWHYATFSNGVAVPRDARLLYRDSPALRAAGDDPFDAEGLFYAWLFQAQAGMLTLPASGAS